MKNYSLLSHNTLGIEAKAANFLEYDSVGELKSLLAAKSITCPFLHIGQGSNLLFTKDYEGTILHSRIMDMQILSENDKSISVRVGAGVLWDDFVAHCVEREWYGAENLSYIPGEVGASAVQNIGAYGVEVKDLIDSVETVNIEGKEKKYPVDTCGYAYRKSIFKQPCMKSVFITHVTFTLSKFPCYKLDYGSIREELAKYSELNLSTVRRVIIEIRTKKLPDPKLLGNAGSFFMNPIILKSQFEDLICDFPLMPHYDIDDIYVKIPAGWLIEQCGWKGKALGRAAVYDKQALVLVNLGGATAKDIVDLADAVRASVHNKFQIDIQPEVNYI